MPKCVMLEKGITYRPGGKLYPCCLWRWQSDQKDITDYKQFRKIIDQKKDQMNSSDSWIPECEQCRQDTEFKGESFRDHANEIVEGGFWEMNFNNTCNLSCRMCNGGLSSTWASLIKQNKSLNWDESYTDFEYKETLKYDEIEFYSELPNVRHIKLLGGEPFLMKEVYRMLDFVMESGHAKNINLHVTTNITNPVTDWWIKVIEKFKHVQFMCSVDGYESRYEYIRPGAKFDVVLKNIEQIRDLKHENIKLSISCCGQTLTASQHNTIKSFLNNFGVTNVNIEQVYDPFFMSYRSLKPLLRQKYNIKPSFDYDEQHWNTLVQQMAIQDNLFGTNFRKECPELFE